MIISHLIGGLGNQMFQYAAGRALSLERKLPLKLDVAGFAGYGLHQGFELQRVFTCPTELATQAEVRAILGWQYTPVIRRVMVRSGIAALRRKGWIVEPHFQFWAGITRVPEDAYLAGYWQSEKYFQSQANQIRTDFTFSAPLSQKNAEWSAQIAACNAISLHVRRGDYVANPKTHANHGVCSLEYYRAAIRLMGERVAHPEFFVFSDDMPWVQANLQVDAPCHFIAHNRGTESYNDMRLMSLCRHHIIANSSFSWWGAWLNARADKLVIAPRNWFANDNRTDDLFPAGWVRL